MMEKYEERDLVSEDEYDEAVEEMNRVLGKRKSLLSRSGMAGLGRLGLHPPKKVAKINGSEDEPTDDYAADSDKEITLPKEHQRKKVEKTTVTKEMKNISAEKLNKFDDRTRVIAEKRICDVLFDIEISGVASALPVNYNSSHNQSSNGGGMHHSNFGFLNYLQQ
eukprot:gene14439-biopygen4227